MPGRNVDRLDVGAGLRRAARIGSDDPRTQTVAEDALLRHARGEDEAPGAPGWRSTPGT